MSPAEKEQQLRQASDAYYNGKPTMSDAEFDKLWKAHQFLRKLTPDADMWRDTILDKVGAQPSQQSGFGKVKHISKMMSLENIFVQTEGNPLDELFKWLTNIAAKYPREERIRVVIEPKIDGLSASVIYADGILSRVVTRGDGEEGEDITANALAAGLVSRTLIPDMAWGNIHTRGVMEFRGEIYMPFDVFNVLCVAATAIGEDPPANPRNAAAGMIRRKDASSLPGSGLKFLVHGIENPQRSTYLDAKASAAALGLPILEQLHFAIGDRFDEQTYRNLRQLAVCAYPTDGLVFKLDSFKLREELGFTSRAPKWAIALKFEQEQVQTKCNAITVQVGRSGILTPVAELEPIEVDGSVVSRATLHNEEQINRLGLLPGDTVILQKAGGIIPEIVSVGPIVLRAGRAIGKSTTLHQMRSAFSLLQHIDNKCPSCGNTDIVVDGARYRCNNLVGCKAQMAARVEHMASRGCLNILGLGEEACDAIAQRGDIKHPFDILDKPVDWFASLAWVTDTGKNMTFGKSRATKVVAACADAKKQPLNRWITSLGIHSIGENTGKEISRLCEDTNELNWACRPMTPVQNPKDGVIYSIAKGADKGAGDLAKFAISNHLGPVSCNELVDFVASDIGLSLLRRIDEYGIKSDNYNPIPMTTTASSGAFAGKTFAITGKLSQTRDHFKDLIEEAGGKVTDTISAKLTALVCGEGGGGKRDKAAKAGVEVWDEERLMKELGA